MSLLRPPNRLRLLHALPRPGASLQQSRYFHPTRRSPFIVNDILNVSSGFIYGVHSYTGLPWVLSIPLTAFIVRMVVAFPLQLFSRINALKERNLYPLLQSWRNFHREQTLADSGLSYAPISSVKATRLLAFRMNNIRNELHRQFGVSRFWKVANIVQLPVWLSLMESLRAMCGTNNGLVPFLLSLTRSASDYVPPAAESSFASEGALWFPDLLAGDPTGVLPVVLTASILLNIRIGWKSPPLKRAADLPDSVMIRHLALWLLRSLVQVLAINVGVSGYFQEMPCALMIYWITSTNVATLQTSVLEKYMAPSPLQPWKRVYIDYRLSEKERQYGNEASNK